MRDEEIEIDLTTLDEVETGGEFTRVDYLTLGIIGIILPALLLVMGAL